MTPEEEERLRRGTAGPTGGTTASPTGGSAPAPKPPATTPAPSPAVTRYTNPTAPPPATTYDRGTTTSPTSPPPANSVTNGTASPTGTSVGVASPTGQSTYTASPTGNTNGVASPTGVPLDGVNRTPPPDPGQPVVDEVQQKALNDLEEARRLRAQLLAQMGQPGAAAPTLATPPQVAAPAPVTAPTVGVASVAPAVMAGQTTVQRTAPMTAASVGPMAQAGQTTIAPVARATAATIAPVERIAAARVGGPQDQVRARQTDLLRRLEGIESGTGGPTLAELQLKRGLDAAVGDQMGIAAGARGFGRLAALKAAGRNTAKLQQQTNLDAAMARVKEQDDARRSLLSALDSTRGQDIAVGTTDATLSQDAAKTNAGAANTAGLTGAQLSTDVAKFNAGAENTRGLTQAQIDAERERFNTGETNKGTLTDAGFKQDAAKTNTLVTSDESKAQAGIDSQKALADADAANKVNALAATFAQQSGMTQAQLDADTAKFNTEIAQRADFKNVDLTQQANLANLQAELQQRGLNQAQQLAYLQGAVQSQGQVLDYAKAKMMADAAKTAADRSFWGGLAGSLLSAGATALPLLLASDRRLKTDVSPMDRRRELLSKMDGGGGKDDLAQLLDGIKGGYRYKYKDPSAPGQAPGEHFGPMAQDLERAGPIGASLVRDTPNGKMVDTGRAALVALAALSKMREETARKKGARV